MGGERNLSEERFPLLPLSPPPFSFQRLLTLSNPCSESGDTWEFFVFLVVEEKKHLGDFFLESAFFEVVPLKASQLFSPQPEKLGKGIR